MDPFRVIGFHPNSHPGVIRRAKLSNAFGVKKGVGAFHPVARAVAEPCPVSIVPNYRSRFCTGNKV